MHGGGSLDLVADGIERWRKRHRGEREAGFVYAGLLDAGVGVEELREELLAWLNTYQHEYEASFVYCDWLDHKGGAEAIASHVRAWLDKYRTDVKAGHVYRSWLDAGGAVDAIREDIDAWLDQYKGFIEAQFVIIGWLEATKDFEHIREPALAWLSAFYRCERALFAIKHLAEQSDLPLEAVRQILTWCCLYADHLDAVSRMSRLGPHVSSSEIAPQATRVAKRIADALSKIERLDKYRVSFFTGIISRIYNAAQTIPVIETEADELFLTWLKHPKSFNPAEEVFLGNQQIGFIFAASRLIRDGKVAADSEPITRFYRWVKKWKEFSISRAQAARSVERETWDGLEDGFRAGQPFSGSILCPVVGGYAVDLGGAIAFMRSSEVDISPVRDITPLLGSPQRFQIQEMDRSRGTIVVSRRALLEEGSIKRRSELVAVEEGRILDGVVKNITDYGAFVDLHGVDGLLHLSQITRRRIKHPSEALHVGQEVRVQVIRFDPKTQRFWLGMKQLEPDPWEGFAMKYPAGARVKGLIAKIVDYGVFVELEPGLNGLVHSSELSWTRNNVHPQAIVSTSQEVEVMVLGVDPQNRRISLSLRQALANPWQTFADQHPLGGELDGKVHNITEFGLFVSLPNGIRGMVHVSDIAWNRHAKNALGEYRKGQPVRVKLLGVDVEKQRISLGIKQLQRSPGPAERRVRKASAIKFLDT